MHHTFQSNNSSHSFHPYGYGNHPHPQNQPMNTVQKRLSHPFPHIYHRIRDLREDADLTQAEISSHLHISQRAYSHYENGTRDIPTNILVAIADYFDVSTDYLLNRTNKKTID